MAITGAVTSLMAFTVASFGDMPFSICDCTASTTTIASSTTIPIASTRPRSESTLIVKPINGNTIKAAIRDTGIAIVGIRAALQSCINIKTTNITRANAMKRVTIISLIPAVMASVVSIEMVKRMLSGKDLDKSSIVCLAILASSVAFDPGAW